LEGLCVEWQERNDHPESSYVYENCHKDHEGRREPPSSRSNISQIETPPILQLLIETYLIFLTPSTYITRFIGEIF